METELINLLMNYKGDPIGLLISLAAESIRLEDYLSARAYQAGADVLMRIMPYLDTNDKIKIISN